MDQTNRSVRVLLEDLHDLAQGGELERVFGLGGRVGQ